MSVAQRELAPDQRLFDTKRQVNRSLIANYVASGWSGLMGIGFVPVYISQLGAESFALIGIHAALQVWLVALDMGMAPTLSREIARFEAGASSPRSIVSLFRSIEMIYLAIALLISLVAVLLSPLVATAWLRAASLPTNTLVHALAMTGLVIAFRWQASLYRSALIGFQRQVWLSGSTIVFSTLRGAGAAVLLLFVSRSIVAFFAYQAAVSATEAAVLAGRTRQLMPRAEDAARFSIEALRSVWGFASAMAIITVLSILLSQLDKVLLSRLLPLAEFGHYSLAGMIAGALYLLTGPISMVAYPKLTELSTFGDKDRVLVVYLRLSRLASTALLPASAIIALFSDHLLLLWTRDPTLTKSVAPLLSAIIVGNTLNALMYMPYNLQIAHGWTSFIIRTNIAALLILTPLMYFGALNYGAIAAVAVWILLNLGYVFGVSTFVHRELLPGQSTKWLVQMVVIPGGIAYGSATFLRWLFPTVDAEHPLRSAAILVISATLVFLATVLGFAEFRTHLLRRFRLLR